MAFEIIVLNRFQKVPEGYFPYEVMRPNILGNPYYLNDEKDRDKVIALYKKYLWRHMNNETSPINKVLRTLADTANDIALVCCCKPKACHADIIKSAILWIRNNK